MSVCNITKIYEKILKHVTIGCQLSRAKVGRIFKEKYHKMYVKIHLKFEHESSFLAFGKQYATLNAITKVCLLAFGAVKHSEAHTMYF